MKPTKEEILKKHCKNERGHWIGLTKEGALTAMQEYAEAYHKEKIGDTSIDALDFVHQWFYKLSIGQTTQGEVADAIEQFHKKKLREEAILFANWLDNIVFLPENAKKVIDEYLNTLNTK